MVAQEQFHLRVPAEDKEFIERAAKVSRMSVTRFLLNLGLDRAQELLGVRTDTPTPGNKELVGTSALREAPEKVQELPAEEPPVDDEPEGYYDEDGDWVINRPARPRRGLGR